MNINEDYALDIGHVDVRRSPSTINVGMLLEYYSMSLQTVVERIQVSKNSYKCHVYSHM